MHPYRIINYVLQQQQMRVYDAEYLYIFSVSSNKACSPSFCTTVMCDELLYLL